MCTIFPQLANRQKSAAAKNAERATHLCDMIIRDYQQQRSIE
jgi:hypothetical protein